MAHYLLSGTLYIRRDVLLKWDPRNDRYEIGSSKDPSSRTVTGFIGRGVPLYTSPAEAVKAYVRQQTEADQAIIAAALADIKKAKADLKRLKKLDASKLKVEGKPDNWTPCDY